MLEVMEQGCRVRLQAEERHVKVFSDSTCVDLNRILPGDSLREGTLYGNMPVFSLLASLSVWEYLTGLVAAIR